MGLIVDARQAKPAPGRFPGVVGQPLMNEDLGSVAVTMSVLTLEPGAVLPLHTHVAEESFFVIEGTGFATVGSVEHPIGPEMALLASAGELHGFANRSDKPLRIVCVHPVGKHQTKWVE